MRVSSARLESLASPAFIATLAVLVINDVALKPLFHVKLDRETLEFTASGYDRERDVRVLARRIRSEVEERFPALAVIDSTTGPLHEFGETTIFVVRGLSGSDVARQKGTFSSIVGDVARAQGLESDKALRYYTEDGFELEYSSFQVVPVLDEDGMLLVKVSSRSPERDDALRRAVNDQLAIRLAAAFGTENVTRHISRMPPLEWVD